eukprot:364878-Chlamydomonas_euryale.AAC.3
MHVQRVHGWATAAVRCQANSTYAQVSSTDHDGPYMLDTFRAHDGHAWHRRHIPGWQQKTAEKLSFVSSTSADTMGCCHMCECYSLVNLKHASVRHTFSSADSSWASVSQSVGLASHRCRAAALRVRVHMHKCGYRSVIVQW